MKIPDITKRLEDQTILRDELARDSVESHMDLIADLIVGSGVKVCAFVDGLDEYEGDLWSLCSTLESLHSRTGIKMCLASRPEPAFEATYSESASITMQDHNRGSIKVYTRSKVAKFTTQHPFVQGLFPEELLDLVVEKAQGVILWARLVVEEMIKSCEEDTSSTDLYAFLETLPTELGKLYERILGKSNQKYQAQAALVLHLLNEADGSLPAFVLYQAWNYLDVNVSRTIKNTGEVDPKIYSVTIKALLGNLIEFVPPRPDTLRINIIHKPLSAYLAQTRWIMTRLSPAFLRVYPNDFWARFASDMVKQACQDSVVDITSTVDKLQETVRAAAQRHEAWLIAHHRINGAELHALFRDGIYAAEHMCSISQDWKPWGDLLLYTIDHWFDITASSSLNASKFPDQAEDLALLHLLYCIYCSGATGENLWVWKRVLRLHESRVLSLILQLYHGESQSAMNTLEERQREGLSVAVLEDLYDVALVSDRPGKPTPAFLTFLQVKFAIYVDVRHLCSLETMLYRGSLTLQHQMSHRLASTPWTIAHDKDCPYHHRDTKLFLQMGLSLNEPLYGNERSLLHEILEHAFRCFDVNDAKHMFATAAACGATPSLKGQAKNDLYIFARNQLKRAKLSKLKRFLGSNNDEHTRTPEKIQFLEAVVKVLKQYSANGGRWPGDLQAVLKARLWT
ncbi:hypothetical protein LTR70_010104 [Exophiala xenobiotica]|uniref:Uncharacterized protein n=1 Tax=Lithohypha guttulata TaxID=1690604 RepID=A0ABR0JUB4_9EURO|nr:hypothetical protein LTR24_010310 [Lithohypha guttulata]KAK5309654.1 hypothetical protein LTR70_010104 [Exophiala xenobiotica]